MDSNPKEAINRLYESHADAIYRYARLSLQNNDEAYDVVQEVFARALKAWPSFRGDASERTWLTRIAHNCIYDLVHKRNHEHRLLGNYRPPDLSSEPGQVETVIMIEHAVAELNEEYRQVFILRHVQDLSVRDTAKILDWSPGKVRITDFRALAKLRNALNSGKEVKNRHEYNT